MLPVANIPQRIAMSDPTVIAGNNCLKVLRTGAAVAAAALVMLS